MDSEDASAVSDQQPTLTEDDNTTGDDLSALDQFEVEQEDLDDLALLDEDSGAGDREGQQ
jgi:hypothetical protein